MSTILAASTGDAASRQTEAQPVVLGTREDLSVARSLRGALVEPGREFVGRARGAVHDGIYGLGEWREELDARGEAVLISSPSWAGAYPWVDKATGAWGFFCAHVDTNPRGAAARDEFNAFYESAIIPMLVREAFPPPGGTAGLESGPAKFGR